ncbi:hypothetical protein JAAARDRAFT_334105 [Jaapia argillacea MUCL 33604]|uniref:Secreted protein n=1 Tax=Jaapia argillacea MUCL 33604 TaxID=933084 RepID=A0A067PNJ0_9AGAM|nr:hypothetical protein JAAARDRAFT_334105 [Jaapia argillacea MUCL 33604]
MGRLIAVVLTFVYSPGFSYPSVQCVVVSPISYSSPTSPRTKRRQPCSIAPAFSSCVDVFGNPVFRAVFHIVIPLC